MTKKEAKIKALEYIINTCHAFAELSNDSELYTVSVYDKIDDAISDEFNILEKKLERLKERENDRIRK